MKPINCQKFSFLFSALKTFLSLFIVVFVSSLVLAQPRIKLEGGVRRNLGTLKEGEQVVRVFVIKNVGTDTLFVTDVSTSCGCTVADQSEFHLAPQDSARVKITFDTNESTGRVKRYIYIESNDPRHDELTITMEATIVPLVEVEPRYISFREMKLGERSTRTVSIINRMDSPLTFSTISIPDSQLSAQLSTTTAYPAIPVELNVQLTARKIGKVLGQIILQTDSPQKPEIRISYVGFVK